MFGGFKNSPYFCVVNDMFWMEQQLDLIEKIGLQNWLVQQL